MVRSRVLLLFVLLFLATTGMLALWTPFGVDQAIFVYGGRTLTSGGALYVDFWDIKPPGIFILYALAGALAGFSEPAIHALELFWQAALAWVLLRIAWTLTQSQAIAVLAPAVSLGCYWTWSRAPHLTQVEALVGLPIAGSLLLAQRISRQPASRLDHLLLGIILGVVAALKPIYLVFPLTFCLLALGTISTRTSSGNSRFSSVGRKAVAFSLAAGVALVWMPLIILFAVHGAAEEMLRTTFVYPFEAVAEVEPAPWKRLVSSASWCGRIFLPCVPLLGAGLWAVLQKSRNSFLAAGVGAYLLIAAAAILVQKTSWWEYHFVLLFPPLGLLASLGLDRLMSWQVSQRAFRALRLGFVVAVTVLPFVDLTAELKRRLAELERARSLSSEAPLSVRLDSQYLRIWENTWFLRDPEASLPGRIYVFGDFRLLLTSGRQQAIAVRGHAWQHLPRRHRERLPHELISAKPVYLFVGGWYREQLREQEPWLWRQIRKRYRPENRLGQGQWFRLRRVQ